MQPSLSSSLAPTCVAPGPHPQDLAVLALGPGLGTSSSSILVMDQSPLNTQKRRKETQVPLKSKGLIVCEEESPRSSTQIYSQRLPTTISSCLTLMVSSTLTWAIFSGRPLTLNIFLRVILIPYARFRGLATQQSSSWSSPLLYSHILSNHTL